MKAKPTRSHSKPAGGAMGAARARRFISLARVSSRPQEVEGFSLESQEEALDAYAAKEGGVIVRRWRITETASKTDRRKNFKELLAYAKANAATLDGLLVCKVDRACRNMTDYGRLLELEATHGVPLITVNQPTQNTPAGRMARNMMAAMGTFFAEQLSVDVKQGLAQRVRDGWFPTVPPYGYQTTRTEGRSLVSILPTEADNVRRVFHLYAYEHCTLDMILERLKAEGRTYSATRPKWVRSKIHRFCATARTSVISSTTTGWVPGRHEAIIDRHTFDRVQALLGVKIYKKNELTYGGELMTCGHCGRPVTGERVVNRHGKVYVYYRCAGYTAPDHPRVRLREEQVDEQILGLFDRMQQPEPLQRRSSRAPSRPGRSAARVRHVCELAT